MPEKLGCFYAFGPFLLDTAQQVVFRDDNLVPLTPKTYDTLLVLIENRGRVLSKNELMKALWPNSFVEEANLTQQISTIRKALGEAASTDPYIVTVPGRGYRFAATVTELSRRPAPLEPVSKDESGVSQSEPEPEPQVAPEIDQPAAVATSTKRFGGPWSARVTLPILVILGIGLVALGYFGHRRQTNGEQPRNGPRSLAILPFQSLNRDANSDFLGFSLVDAIITRLGYVNSLTVRPSYAVAKYRNQLIDIPKVAADLRVDTLLTGSFIRDGDDLRITSQLIDVHTQKILWKNTFDLKYEKLLTVQDSVAREIIKELELRLSPLEGERLKPDKPINPLAYEYYLRGVDLYSKNDFPMAIRMLEKSAELDPGYPLTWAQLGRAYTASASFQFGGREQYRKAQVVYEKAMSFQPAPIEAQIYMANFLTDTGSPERAVTLLKQAIKTNPNHAEAHWELGYAYRFGGMLTESVAECTRARQLDPSVKLGSSALNAWLYLGEYDKFLESLPKDRESAFLVFYRGYGQYYKKNWREAVTDFDRAFALDSSILQAAVGKAIGSALKHKIREGQIVLREAEEKVEQRGVGDPEAIYKIAQAYAVLGDKLSALRLLKHSVEGGFFPYPYLTTDPLLDSLRDEAEFVRLMTVARKRHESFKTASF